MTATVEELLAESRAALRAGDAASARRALDRAGLQSPTADVVEGLARASYLELDFPAAIEGWERAYAAHRDADDAVGAVRVARTLSCMHLVIAGDRAVAAGWLARAQTLLAGVDDSSERGWVALNIGMFEGDRARKEEHFHEALAVARRFRDTDLEFVTLAYLGASLVHADRTEEGMVLLDEALAAVAGSEVDDFFVLEEIFCQLFAACEHAHDVTRADQWIRIGESIAERRRLPAVSAFCRTHYGGVLTDAGRWPEADATLTEAIRLWGLGRRSLLRNGALVRLADLRVLQGRFEEAEQLLDGLDDDAEVARPSGRHPPGARRHHPRARRPRAGPRPGRTAQLRGRSAAGAPGRRPPGGQRARRRRGGGCATRPVCHPALERLRDGRGGPGAGAGVPGVGDR